MKKFHYILLLAGILLLGSCQSIEQLSIDYMLPADISFPASLKRVAIVNNVASIPEQAETRKAPNEDPHQPLTHLHNGDATLTTESLAETLAEGNYFDEVVICDSSLCTTSDENSTHTLSAREVNQLVNKLDVDFLIALENIQLNSTRKISYLSNWGFFYGTVDVKVYPTVRIYLPNRKGPMATINSNDSIFWEETEATESALKAHLIDEKEMIRQASEFAGTVPVKHLLPYWKTVNRYFFSGGSVNMRDAAIYAREHNWDKAINLWKQQYDNKKGKQQMYAAYNIALGYEMKDDITQALEWALKAQQIAQKVDKIDEQTDINSAHIPNFLMTSIYVNELQERKEGIMRLNVQMERFKEE